MKIGYFINTFKSSNWGGQATSNGIKYLLKKEYPNAKFIPIDLPELPYKKIKIFRKLYEILLYKAILDDNYPKIIKILKKMNVKENIFNEFSHICFNGEGAIHHNSGHLIRLMGLLYLALKQGKIVASINQTIDMNHNEKLEKLVSKVYNMCDFVSVREPISYESAKKMGIKKCKLIPDAVYGLPIMQDTELKIITKKFHLPKKYITITGSSILKRDISSENKMRRVLKSISYIYPKTKLVFMASTKTDIYLARKLEKEFDLKIFTHKDIDYKKAIAIIAKSTLLVGGRQHPNIFAYIYKVPYLIFEGNTFKNIGIAKLQNYPLLPLSYDDNKILEDNLIKIQSIKIDFKKINLDRFKIFKVTRSIKSKQNIAIVVTNLAGSGAEKVALAQAEMFKNNGHFVTLFILEKIINYNIEKFDFPIIPLTKIKNTYKIFGKFGDKIYAKILQREMNKICKFDVIISNLPRADRAVKQLKHPNKFFVIHMSYKAEIDRFSAKRAIKKLKLYRYLYNNEKIITVSKAIINDFKELNIKYKNATTIYNPFDFEYIRKKGEEKIDIDYEYIISPSAFRKQKRYDVMLDAFKLLKSDVNLLILSKKNPKLDKMILERDLQNRVVVLGFQQNPYKYIKNAKLLVLSSDREGLPTVIIESLILGTPVVSTDCPTGPKEILTDQLSNWLVPVQNPVALAKKVDIALDSNIVIEEEVIEKFNKDNIYEKYKKLCLEN